MTEMQAAMSMEAPSEPTTSEDDYPVHSVKQDTDRSFLLAKRTGLDGEKAWQVYRPDGPPHFVAHADIEAWADLVVKDAP